MGLPARSVWRETALLRFPYFPLRPVTPEKNVHLYFRTASIERFVAQSNKTNVAFSNLKDDSNTTNIRIDGVKQLYLQDPNGYWIEVNDTR